MNAIDFLIKEHQKVRKIFAEINKSISRDTFKQALFNSLCQDLIRHETMEQEIWYPQLKKNEKLRDIITNLITEERSAAKAIKKFSKLKTKKEWKENFLKLKKDVEHHASEEESKLFPKVERLFEESELKRIGKELQEFKVEFEAAL